MNDTDIKSMKKATTMFTGLMSTLLLVVAALVLSPVEAQEQTMAESHAEHMVIPATTTPMGRDSKVTSDGDAMADMEHDATMNTGSMQGGSAPPDARDPHAYADGYDFGPYTLELADQHSLGYLLVDNLETVRSNGSNSTAYDVQAWYGRTFDRVVLKAEGDIDNGKVAEARSELLWGHAITGFWDTQLGVRYDSGEGPNRGWLAFGVQGLAPYWFEVEATGYLGEEGRTALRLDMSYELLLTQKLVLQPRIEANAYGKSDTARGLGDGIADMSLALRLRYEIRREFAPYLGVEWARNFGATQDLVQAAGGDASETVFVAGLRFWF